MIGEREPSLPTELRDRATALAGELAWTGRDACDVIDHLAAKGFAVVGVELWNEIDGAPSWLATSNYECPTMAWEPYVSCCATGARGFVGRFADTPGALFNLTWIHRDEKL